MTIKCVNTSGVGVQMFYNLSSFYTYPKRYLNVLLWKLLTCSWVFICGSMQDIHEISHSERNIWKIFGNYELSAKYKKKYIISNTL